MFTGDGSAIFLMRALYAAGFANQPTSDHDRDGLQMVDAFMTAAARCAPPQNKPLPVELANCGSYLDRELLLLSRIRVVLALGRMAFKSYLDRLRLQGILIRHLEFKHGGKYTLPRGLPVLIASYHPSRQNTQTKRLTPEMMDAVLNKVRSVLVDS
jgi:uracil-DNA glycosylase family 4